jgi:hypothetical protein
LKIRLPKKLSPHSERVLTELNSDSSWNPNKDYIQKMSSLINF